MSWLAITVINGQCTVGTIDNASVDNGNMIDAVAAVVADADAVDAGLLGCDGNVDT